MKTFFRRLFKKPPTCPAFRPQDSIGTAYRSFDTAAQIGAYAEARADRLDYAAGLVPDMTVTEPGLVPQVAYLDLSADPAVTWDSQVYEDTVPARRL